MGIYTRRAFLRSLASGVGGIAALTLLEGCTPKTATQLLRATKAIQSTLRPLPTSPPTDPMHGFETSGSTPTYESLKTSEPTERQAQPQDTDVPTPQPEKPDLVVVHGPDPEQIVYKAIDAIGGMKQFIKPGGKVVIKPNICVDYHTYEYAATTNPWVVGALVRLCLEAGAGQVLVMDFPFGGDGKIAYVKSGIQEQVEAAGGSMHYMTPMKFQKVEIPEAKALKSIGIYDEILSADTLINVPIPKTHGLAKLTLGMKNMLGVIDDRPEMHRWLGEKIADLLSQVKPTLTVVDAVRILVNNGPTGGNLDDVRKLDTVIVSQDFVAADSYATSLFDMKPKDIQYIKAAAERGYGQIDLGQVKVEELTIGG